MDELKTYVLRKRIENGLNHYMIKREVALKSKEIDPEGRGIQYMSGDKNIVPLKVAISGFFCFIGTNSCPEPRTRT